MIVVPLTMIAAGSFYLHRRAIGATSPAADLMYCVWALSLGFVLAQLALAWLQRPFKVSEAQQA